MRSLGGGGLGKKEKAKYRTHRRQAAESTVATVARFSNFGCRLAFFLFTHTTILTLVKVVFKKALFPNFEGVKHRAPAESGEDFLNQKAQKHKGNTEGTCDSTLPQQNVTAGDN